MPTPEDFDTYDIYYDTAHGIWVYGLRDDDPLDGLLEELDALFRP